jgi:hypothetical protein
MRPVHLHASSFTKQIQLPLLCEAVFGWTKLRMKMALVSAFRSAAAACAVPSAPVASNLLRAGLAATRGSLATQVSHMATPFAPWAAWDLPSSTVVPVVETPLPTAFPTSPLLPIDLGLPLHEPMDAVGSSKPAMWAMNRNAREPKKVCSFRAVLLPADIATPILIPASYMQPNHGARPCSNRRRRRKLRQRSNEHPFSAPLRPSKGCDT